MVQPVLSLTAKVEEVRRGNLNVEIDTGSLRDAGEWGSRWRRCAASIAMRCVRAGRSAAPFAAPIPCFNWAVAPPHFAPNPLSPTRKTAFTPVIEQALAQVERLLKKRRIHVAKDIAAGLPIFPLDPAQVERALVNVLSNAIETTPVGGHLHIGAALSNGDLAEEIEVTITDDRPGLGNRDPEEFFKPFFTTKLQGAGLGLHIVRKIMESHQGKVRLESPDSSSVFSKKNRGNGTRAVLTFPTRLKVYETETHHFGYR
jgi:nitrogen fixation/metabolism regulation signal transduction histidine kinase